MSQRMRGLGVALLWCFIMQLLVSLVPSSAFVRPPVCPEFRKGSAPAAQASCRSSFYTTLPCPQNGRQGQRCRIAMVSAQGSRVPDVASRAWDGAYLGLPGMGLEKTKGSAIREECQLLAGDAGTDHVTTYDDVLVAKDRLKDNVLVSDCALQQDLSKITGTRLYLKKEFQQYTGAFKERGARNVLEQLLMQSKCGGVDVRIKGVVAASAGNHALGLACHGAKMGIPVTVVMPLTAPMTKVNRCKAMGARVIQHGETFGEAKEFAMTCKDLKGIPYIDPFNDPYVIAGAGTMGLEILQQVPDVDAIIVPVGGAGLIAGLSLAIKTHRPEVLIIGAEPLNAASLTAALKNGHPSEVDVSYTVADGLSVPKIGQKSFELAHKYVDDVVTVPEHLIPLAILRLVEMERAVVEGAGAIGLASLLPGGPLHGKLEGKRVCTILTGGNIDTTTLGRIIDRGLAADRRLLRFQLHVPDRPGTLSEVARVIGSKGANIKDLYHERAWEQGPINMLTVVCSVEIGGVEHERELKEALLQNKYQINWPE